LLMGRGLAWHSMPGSKEYLFPNNLIMLQALTVKLPLAHDMT
jgi:hypothetical protein